MSGGSFESSFAALLGFEPFAWQERLYASHFLPGQQLPSSIDIPTGLGKTVMVAVGLLARQ